MSESNELPELPLMLAGIPRGIVELLREAGLPCEPLPRTPLAATGVGRFVLFDSRNARSAAQAKRARNQGLDPLDLAAFAPVEVENSTRSTQPGSYHELLTRPLSARAFLDRLKSELELRGGVWCRLADFPFPYQSAIAVAIEHLSEELTEFAAIADVLPGRATHFVSTRLRADRLALIAESHRIDLGWQIRPEDCESSPRRTLAHWLTRLERFRSAGLGPLGLALAPREWRIPTGRGLSQLGLLYECRPYAGTTCLSEPPSRGTTQSERVRFGTFKLPPHDRFVEWIGEHYQSGCPLFLAETTARLDLVHELLLLAGDAGRCSLMWQTTLGDYARWWLQRRSARLQVWRRAGAYEIHSNENPGPFPWAIEIWRGSHLATLPLSQSALVVSEDGLIYLRANKKNPAGCTTPNDAVLELAATADRNRPG